VTPDGGDMGGRGRAEEHWPLDIDCDHAVKVLFVSQGTGCAFAAPKLPLNGSTGQLEPMWE